MKTSFIGAGMAVHALRVSFNVSTKELAALMKISDGSISKMEKGDSNVTANMASAYEKALSLPKDAISNYIRIASAKGDWLDTLQCAIAFRKEWLKKGYGIIQSNNP